MNVGRGRETFLRVGLTGGIASGKSAVGGMLAERGLPLVDADSVVHDLLSPGGGAVAPTLEAFGPSVAEAGGGIDRTALGRLVFRDAAARARLESLIHPLVIEESERRLERAGQLSGIVVYEAALLVETGRHRDFHRLVVVTAARELRVERLRRDRGMTREEAVARIAAQLPDADRVAVADYVIDNSGDRAQTERQVEALAARLGEDRGVLAAGGDFTRPGGPRES